MSYAQHYTGMEIFNANNAIRRMWSINRWDDVLGRVSRKIWGFASDDCHDVCNDRRFDRGWILVNSEIDPKDCCWHGLIDPDTLRKDMLENIRSGNFCAVVRPQGGRHERRRTSGSKDGGPALVVSHSQEQIYVVADRPCDTIEFCAGSSSRRESVAESGSADFAYDVGDWEDYVRVRIVQKRDDGKKYVAFSQPLSIRRD